MKTINLTDVRITNISVDYIREVVSVTYLLESDCDIILERQALFWRVIPIEYDFEGQPIAAPDWYFTLPDVRLQQLVELRNLAKNVLKQKEGIE